VASTLSTRPSHPRCTRIEPQIKTNDPPRIIRVGRHRQQPLSAASRPATTQAWLLLPPEQLQPRVLVQPLVRFQQQVLAQLRVHQPPGLVLRQVLLWPPGFRPVRLRWSSGLLPRHRRLNCFASPWMRGSKQVQRVGSPAWHNRRSPTAAPASPTREHSKSFEAYRANLSVEVTNDEPAESRLPLRGPDLAHGSLLLGNRQRSETIAHYYKVRPGRFQSPDPFPGRFGAVWVGRLDTVPPADDPFRKRPAALPEPICID
jgi:hypothetical protein